MEDINLHFTGDFNAIGLANNLLAAMIDNHIHHGNELDIDVRRITWKRVMDMNDRALRDITVSLGGPANGYPRQDGFDIVVASEVMAIFCLATSVADLKERLGNIVIGYTRQQKPVTARDLKAHGAMTVLLKDALAPEPGADAGEQPGDPARRAVRQHRARLQLGDRDQGEPEARRLRGHRSRLRRRPGRREVHRHQVPQERPAARRGGDRRDDPRAEVPRRRGRQAAQHREPRGAREGGGQPGAPRAQRARALRAALRRLDQQLHLRHRGRAEAAAGPHGRHEVPVLVAATGPRAARVRRTWRARWSG